MLKEDSWWVGVCVSDTVALPFAHKLDITQATADGDDNDDYCGHACRQQATSQIRRMDIVMYSNYHFRYKNIINSVRKPFQIIFFTQFPMKMSQYKCEKMKAQNCCLSVWYACCWLMLRLLLLICPLAGLFAVENKTIKHTFIIWNEMRECGKMRE